MTEKFSTGQKVKPINKTAGGREKDNCGTYYRRLEMKQDFLYVVGINQEETIRLNKMCYWCNVINVLGGDTFAENDLILYETEDNTSKTKEII